LQKQS